MKNPETRANSLRAPLERAARFRLLSLLIETPRPGRQVALRALAEGTPVAWGVDLAPALAADDGEVEAEHFRLLGAAGNVSPAATDYIEGGFADKGPVLADIAGFYRAFGYECPLKDTPDHFANLLGFVSFLALKQAYKDYVHDTDEVKIAADAERKFLGTHVHPYLGRFARRLEMTAAPGGVYQTVSALAAKLAEGSDSGAVLSHSTRPDFYEESQDCADGCWSCGESPSS